MPILEARRIRKHFGGVVALEDGNLSLEPGEVHFLMGSNGSGKSTLCKVIAGVVAPDDGQLELGGQPVRFARPREAKARGIAVVYQELSLIPRLSVARNILLGSEPRGRTGLVNFKRLKAEAAAAARLFGSVLGADFDLDTPVDQLPPDAKQIVEILKALAAEPQIIIFDEATSSLHREQVRVFFELVRDLKRMGKSIVFISHRMEEVFEIGDRATVLRGGKTVGTVNLKETTRDGLVQMMVGHAVGGARLERSHRVPPRPVLRVDGLRSRRLRDVSFELRQGEILGLGGLHGQGQSDLLLCLFGVLPVRGGTVYVECERVGAQSPRRAMQQGFAYVSGDRARHGVLLVRPILENMILCLLQKTHRLLFARKRLAGDVRQVAGRLNMLFGALGSAVNELSGGNQQKVVIGKWLLTVPGILLMDDPTKGIDYHTKEELYGLMRTMCEEGVAVLWHSSEDEELLNHSDRILVFNEGHIVDELAGERLSELELYRSALKSAHEPG
ncbi:MAG: sugar ABC transporter ATP-binding protein [Kiritimatiellae bacterium]|nr:sugar ABC transporter ATP-binding protein [Kiritimatiellia bacterium]